VELASVAFVGTQSAFDVALVAVGTIDLLAGNGGGTQAEQDAALGVGQVVGGGGAVGGTDLAEPSFS
jgi:hypothetical protein